MPRSTSVLGVAVGAAMLLVVPAGASAMTAHLNQRCYTHVPTKGSQPIVVSLAGGTPGANFLVAATVPRKGLGSAGSATGTFDGAGNGTAQIDSVFPPNGTIEPTKGQRVDLSVQDFGAGAAVTPIGSTLVTTLALSVASKPSNPRAKRMVRVSGSQFARKRMYGFIVRGKSKHVLRRFSLGRADVCGFTKAKAVVAPKSQRLGVYRLYVNAGKKLHKRKAIHGTFRIYRRAF